MNIRSIVNQGIHSVEDSYSFSMTVSTVSVGLCNYLLESMQSYPVAERTVASVFLLGVSYAAATGVVFSVSVWKGFNRPELTQSAPPLQTRYVIDLTQEARGG